LLVLLIMVTMSTAADTRQTYSSEAPTWLRAVGKLQVPGSKLVNGRRSHYREDCSATLVAKRSASHADTIITAWHCLEFYNDLSKPITFTLLPGSQQSIALEARRLADGGGMHADWAVLRLQRPVARNRVAALTINQRRPNAGRAITMAGYSRDSGKGNHGDTLTFDANCNITGQRRESSDSDCTAHKGASGGAVVQFSLQGQALLSGVISRGDGASVSIYMPVADFRNTINRLLD